ncbi:MAG: right-handed parallel beta-helix repeat-containing protein [Actinomycetota bacterium]|nr:right-handed parallel beta-helix repeat-containing protein [Actinomycetota bacterium]
MSGRRGLARFALGLATLSCATLASLTILGNGPVSLLNRPADTWAAPTQYVERPDNPLPPRNRVRMQPNQFDSITQRKALTGTTIGNILIQKDHLEMLVGDRVVWSAAYRSVPGFDGRLSMADLATLVTRSPHPDWLRQTSTGVYQLQVGLVQYPGTRLEVTAPEVKELRLVSQPYVYLAGVGASVLFQDVKVTSWLPASNMPDGNAFNHRPYISYDAGGRLDISGSEFSYLGTDASKAYGVSWGVGTTGEAARSVFHHNLFGAYTGNAVGVAFRSNVFRDNARYGLDPHTNSSGLIVVDNEAYGNNTHGIIFSKNVNHSIVEGNRSHDNGANGIMMDEKSDFNIIRNNDASGNRGDGIVLQGSSHNVVADNRISGNEVGIRVNANPLGFTDGSRVNNNQLRDNRVGIQVYGGARDTVTQSNQINDSAQSAIVFADPGTSQSDSVTGAHKAVVIDRVATVRGLSTSKVGRGIVVSKGARATVEASQITGQDIAIEVKPEGHISLAGSDGGAFTTVSGARKAIVVSGTADLRNVVIQDVTRGVLVDEGGRATITTTRIVTNSKGVEVVGFNGLDRVQLVSSDVRAPIPLVGSTLWKSSGNTLSAIPSWLAVAGALFVLLAALLHIGHRVFAPMSHVRHQSYPISKAAGSNA